MGGEPLRRFKRGATLNSLNKTAFLELVLLLAAMGALIFLPAWTVDYWQAWVFLALFGVWAAVTTLYLMKRDPQLLARRLKGGPTAEKERSERIIQTITSIGFIAMLVVSALDHRFAWSGLSAYVCVSGDVLLSVGFLIIFLVYRENTFASATIELAPEQKVISTGLYALVRHPMYLGGLFFFVGIPNSLDSWWGLLVFLVMVPALIWRIFDEERFLTKNLSGYEEYCSRVKYRLFPHIW